MNSQKSDDSVQAQQKGRAWGALLLAGGFEVGYALSVNGSQGFTNLAWMGVFDRTEDLERANEQVVTITAGARTVLWGDTRWVDIPFN